MKKGLPSLSDRTKDRLLLRKKNLVHQTRKKKRAGLVKIKDPASQSSKKDLSYENKGGKAHIRGKKTRRKEKDNEENRRGGRALGERPSPTSTWGKKGKEASTSESGSKHVLRRAIPRNGTHKWL